MKPGWKLREFTEKIVWNGNRGENPFLKKILNFYEIYYCRFYKSVLNYICIHELVYNVNSSTQEAVFLINVGIQLFDCLEYGLLLFYKEQKNAVRSF